MTENGRKMLHNFSFDICGLQGAMGYPASAAPTPAPVNYSSSVSDQFLFNLLMKHGLP
ncbi:Uncharacterized protein APZ42_000588 [Daphnia magna]|uniref:Uncharacterized protein n=1 Tax=Daphnia magna TaxID=35525 RepID=A0A162C978_9CRUS|nr:Uncharacterized protein APZ42_000588 [Daphnia magna]